MATLTLSGAAAIASAVGAVAGTGLAYKQGAEANSAAVKQEAAQKAAKKKAVQQREGAARAALGADNNSLFDILGSAQSNK